MGRNFTNDRTGRTTTSPFSNGEVLEKFLKLYGDKEHWLWYHIHNAVMEKDRSCVGGAFDAQTFLADMFTLAIGRGLKKPMIRLHYRDQRFKIYLSGKGTICVKSGFLRVDRVCGCNVGCQSGSYCANFRDVFTHDPVGDEFYVGCLVRGNVLPATQYGSTERREFSLTEDLFFKHLSDDPIRFFAECSRDMNRCCYCNLPLEDERSKTVGYGARCATRWGLPWGEKEGQQMPSFASVHCPELAGLMAAARDNPDDDLTWQVISDWLEERGLGRLEKPVSGVTIPRI